MGKKRHAMEQIVSVLRETEPFSRPALLEFRIFILLSPSHLTQHSGDIIPEEALKINDRDKILQINSKRTRRNK